FLASQEGLASQTRNARKKCGENVLEAELGTTTGSKRDPKCCSADFQSAVSPNCIRQAVRKCHTRRTGRAWRIEKSAIQRSAAEPQPKERGQLCPRVRTQCRPTRGQGCPRSSKIITGCDDSRRY